MVPSTAAERGREMRERLLATASELIAELGWNGVSTRILAERAGVRPGLVHYHFPSLPTLLRQAAMRTVREFVDTAAEMLVDSATPVAGVERLLSDLDQYSGRDPFSLLISEAYLAATRDEELRAELRELTERFHRALADRLSLAGQDAPESTATVLMAVFDGFALHKGINPDLSGATISTTVRRIVTAGEASE